MPDDNHKATLYGFAMGAADVAPRQLQKAFDTIVRTRGGRPEDESTAPSDGVSVEAQLHTLEEHGAWVLMQTEHELPFALAHELAVKVNKTITVHAVEARERVVEDATNEDEWGYENHRRSVDIRPDGETSERAASVDARYAALSHGSFQETVSAILWMMVCEQEAYAPLGEPRVLAYVLPSPRTSALPPRLAELATLIGESGEFSVQDVGGQTMLRITLPDGSRRFGRVTPEELTQLRETTGIEPS